MNKQPPFPRPYAKHVEIERFTFETIQSFMEMLIAADIIPRGHSQSLRVRLKGNEWLKPDQVQIAVYFDQEGESDE